MKDQNNPIAGKTLKALVDRLVSSSLNEALARHTALKNEVPDSPLILMDEQEEVPLISELLTMVVTNSQHGDIRITAHRRREMITVQVQDRSNHNGLALESALFRLQTVVHRTGGSLNIHGLRQLCATVSMNIPQRRQKKPAATMIPERPFAWAS